jgi:hypothetical protein
MKWNFQRADQIEEGKEGVINRDIEEPSKKMFYCIFPACKTASYNSDGLE